MKVLSLDQSTVKTGYAIFNGSDLVAHGVIDLSGEKDTWVRVQEMRIKVDHIIEDYKPDILVVEGVAMQRNPQVLIELGRLQGLILASGFCRSIPCCIYLPTQWRKLLCIKQGQGVKRMELKRSSMNVVYDAYGIAPGEDECEAICIGLAYLKDIKEIKEDGKEESSNTGKQKRKK